MQCEDEEQEDVDSDFEDPFIAEGLSPSSSDSEPTLQSHRGNTSQRRLHAAKAKREKLKRALFRAKEKREHDREAENEELEDSS
jgi:hypothetical protein